MSENTETNQQVLEKANDLQEKTKESIARTQKSINETIEIGAHTLEELRQQDQQMNGIHSKLDTVDTKLEETKRLQDKYDWWAGNWIGGNKLAATKEAQNEIDGRNAIEYSKVKEVFQHEKFDMLSRTWKKAGMVLCSDPSVSCDDVFDPDIQEQLAKSRWQVDFNLPNIDADGWTYAYDFASLNRMVTGEKELKWNTYVRRRKWKHVDFVRTGIEVLTQRNEERKVKLLEQNRQAAQSGAYIPRVKGPTQLEASGLTSVPMMMHCKSDDTDPLDEESKAGLAKIQQTDAEIDESLSKLDKSMDVVAGLAATMREESGSQKRNLDALDDKMSKMQEKQAFINARQRHLVNSST